MSVDAVALLPPTKKLPVSGVDDRVAPEGEFPLEADWKEIEGPGGANDVWRPLKDGALVILGITFQAPDADVYDAASQWYGQTIPSRIWVFPDTAIPEVDGSAAVRTATRKVGRWVRAGARKRGLLEEIGFTPAESRSWQREAMSGDPKRVAAARDVLEKWLSGKDPKEIDALIAAWLRSR